MVYGTYFMVCLINDLNDSCGWTYELKTNTKVIT